MTVLCAGCVVVHLTKGNIKLMRNGSDTPFINAADQQDSWRCGCSPSSGTCKDVFGGGGSGVDDFIVWPSCCQCNKTYTNSNRKIIYMVISPHIFEEPLKHALASLCIQIYTYSGNNNKKKIVNARVPIYYYHYIILTYRPKEGMLDTGKKTNNMGMEKNIHTR